MDKGRNSTPKALFQGNKSKSQKLKPKIFFPQNSNKEDINYPSIQKNSFLGDIQK